jgi:hypothetical protein
MPLVSKSFSDIITFSRGTNATYFDSAGVLQSAANNVPRFDYNPSTLAAQGLLIEEQRTNLLLQSEDFATSWSTVSSGAGVSPSITTNAAIAPNATNTADEVIFNAGGTTSSDFSYISQSYSSVSETSYAVSIWAKTTSGTAAIFVDCESQNSNVVTVTTSWQRFTFVRLSATTTSRTVRIGVRGGTGTDQSATVLLWGAQLEAGAFPTSYIPTTTTALTRAADVASVNTLSPWFNASEGTIYAESLVFSITNQRIVSFNDGSSNNRILISRGTASGGNVNSTVTDGGSPQVSGLIFGTSLPAATITKAAFAYKLDDFAGSVNGSAAVTDTSGTIPTVNILALGSGEVLGTNSLNGYLRRITYYPRRLSDAELQAITA